MGLSESDALTAEEQQLVDGIVAKIRRGLSDASKRFGVRVVRHGSMILRGRRIRSQGFQERLYSRWSGPLDLYELCLYVAQNCGDYFNRKFRPKTAVGNDYQFEAMVRLQAGAVRVAGEIYALLLSGYASGAHARWRTLHEIAVTALFIAQENKETAERYMHHLFVKSYEDSLQYQKHAKKLKVKPLTQRELRRIKKDYLAVIARYGEDFRKGYAWARPALLRHNSKLKGDKIGFDHLQAAVNVQHWTPYYRMASHAVHPSSTFIRSHLGGRVDIPVILAGPSNADLADPGQGALISLTNATAALLTYESGSLELTEFRLSLSAMVLSLHALSDSASREFIKVHRQLEDEIRAEKGSPPRISGRVPRREGYIGIVGLALQSA
jgi:hypothetical protein